MEGNGNGWYFWFLADFAVLIVMMTAVFLARRHHARSRLQASATTSTTAPAVTHEDQTYKWVGLFPFSYISWFLYSALLIAKIVLLIQMDIAVNIPSEAWYGSTFLTLVIGCAAIVFTLLVDSHHEALTDSPQQAYITYALSYSSLEILDAVAFLSLLFPNQCNPQYRSKLEDLVLGLTCASLLLPTLALYKLARSDFGKSPKSLGMKLMYRLAYLLIINTPFLVIRIYLWTYFNEDVSVFLLKNVILSYVHLRSFIPECREWINNLRKLRDSLLHEERSFDGLPNGETAKESRENTTIELDEQEVQKSR
ncbi:transmembrane protein 121B [Galendromus occidentalis]|uniref:Transmembrane protein 121B n=1 Tax=Galendromus occidentalis TaxID=34638 RepID=A0AAJ7SI04_9ACAR|nr:transmembrane protein 121B [Galendromus occidentalis]